MKKKTTLIILMIAGILVLPVLVIMLINISNKDNYLSIKDSYNHILNEDLNIGYVHTKDEIDEAKSSFKKKNNNYRKNIDKTIKSTNVDFDKLTRDIDVSSISLPQQYDIVQSIAILDDFNAVSKNAKYKPSQKDKAINKNINAIKEDYKKVNDGMSDDLKSVNLNDGLNNDEFKILSNQGFTAYDVTGADDAKASASKSIKAIKKEEDKIVKDKEAKEAAARLKAEKEANAKAEKETTDDTQSQEAEATTNQSQNPSNSSSAKSKSASSSPITLTAAQFNVLKPDDSTYGSWSSRSNAIASTINQSGADIISLNEIYEDYQISDLESLTGYNIIKPTDGTPYGWTSAIAYKSDISLINYGAYFFNNQELYTEGNLAGKYASRTAVWGVFEKDGRTFGMISTQFQNDWYTNTNALQETETRSLANTLISNHDLDGIIVAGDFNMDNYSNSLCTGHNGTYVGSGGPLNYDYVCSSGGVNTSGTVINSGASDHELVYTTVTI